MSRAGVAHARNHQRRLDCRNALSARTNIRDDSRGAAAVEHRRTGRPSGLIRSPRLAATVYAASKAAAEDLCFSFWRAFGVPVTVHRFGATADAVELTTPDSVFARWLFLHAARAQLEKVATDNADMVESIQILRALNDGNDHPVIFADREGTPEVRQWADARDIANGCVRILAVPAAVGDIFNLGGAAPFGADQLANYLGGRLGLAPVTARLPTARPAWYISSARARAVLGYEPRRTVFDMVDDAIQAAPPRIR